MIADNPRTENDAVAEIAKEAARAQAGPTLVEVGKMYAFPTPGGYSLLDLGGHGWDDRLDAPRQKEGTTTVTDVESFLSYYRKHSDLDTEVFVDIDRRTITAVLDAHTDMGPRWGKHRLVLALKTTAAWQAWTGHDRKPLTQEVFANHIEDRLPDVVEPTAATMLEMAQKFQAKTTASFTGVTNLSTGSRMLAYEETTTATGGKDKFDVPGRFKIALKPLDLPNGDGEGDNIPMVWGMEARLRYKVDRGHLSITYLLDDPAAVLKDAVLTVVGGIEGELETVIMRGNPA